MGDPSTLVMHQGNLLLAGRPDIDWSKLWLKTLEQEQNPLDSGRCLNLIGSIEEDVQKGKKYIKWLVRGKLRHWREAS
jgi:hypothetical protein